MTPRRARQRIDPLHQPQQKFFLTGKDGTAISEDKPIIEPERLGIWTAASFILALLALVVGLVGIYRVTAATAILHGEILLVNRKVEAQKSAKATEAPAPAPTAAAK